MYIYNTYVTFSITISANVFHKIVLIQAVGSPD